MAAAYILLAIWTLVHATNAVGPLVTLNHGGQLSGKQFDYNGVDMHLFLGVPYAEAPTGALRFTKPRPPPSWSGVRDATTVGNFCPQPYTVITTLDPTAEYVGDEDCLVLDITVPGGVDPANKKPVMVWIHGGGYMLGSKTSYHGATLAKHGDVIIVAINYRLGMLGFLSEAKGEGNFGLWDQRAAILWVKDNIDKFGGDPDLVTIFGESAGASSVSAQMMGKHNDGLFKRAIQESGSLHSDWGWFKSERQIYEISETLRKSGNCSSMESVYKCLRRVSMKELLTLYPNDPTYLTWHPTPDNDFFPSDIEEQNYNISKRFDLMAGFNKQEAAFDVFFPTTSNMTQESIENGLSRSYAYIVLEHMCNRTTPLSVNLCINFYIKTYGLDSIKDDKERGVMLTFILGELNYNSDTIRQLSFHSKGSKATYAYQFSELSTKNSFGMPTWSKVSASHGDELPLVFGMPYDVEYNITKEYYDPSKLTPDLLMTDPFLSNVSPAEKPLADIMMTAWTNFAISGNPNKPVALPNGAPKWPEYDTVSNQFMELNSTNPRVITTPHKDRIDQVLNNIFKARTAQVEADVVTGPPCHSRESKAPTDTVIG